MNKNDKKQHNKNQKGLVDPSQIREFKVYVETTLMAFLEYKYPQTPKKTLKSLLSHHQVAVGGVPVSRFDFPLYPEDVVTVSKKSIAKRQVTDLPIIFEDQDLIAIDKPSGLLSVATEREKGRTAYRLVSDYMTAKKPKSRIFVVHRLDEDTSGVLVFAKNYETREALQNSWQKIVTSRGYYAIVEGEMEKDSDTLRDYLARNNFHLTYVTKDKEKGKLAVTKYKKMASVDGYSLLDVHIETGRSNQIRVQLGNIGHFIIGDDKYGEPSDPLGRLGLHAYELAFENPLTGKKYALEAELPKNFKKMFFERNVKEEKIARMTSKRSQTESKTAVRMRKAKEQKQYHRFGKGKK